MFNDAVVHDSRNGHVLSRSIERFSGMRSTTRDPLSDAGLAHMAAGALVLVNTSTGRISEEVAQCGVGVATADLSPDGSRVFAGCFDCGVRCFDRATGAIVWTYSGFDDTLQGCSAHPHSSQVLVSSTDGTVRLFDGESGKLLDVYNGGVRPVSDVEWSPDGNRFASAQSGGKALVWNAAETSAIRRVLPAPMSSDVDNLGSLSWDSRRGRLWIAHRYMTFAWNWATGERLPDRDLLGNGKCSPKGDAVACTIGLATISLNTIRDREGGSARSVEESSRFGDDTSSVLAWFPSGDEIAVFNVSGVYVAECVDGEIGPAKKILDPELQATDIECSPDGRFIGCTTTYEYAWIVDRDGAHTASRLEMPHGAGTRCLSWSSDSRAICVGCSDGRARVFELGSDESSRVLVGHAGRIESVAWHPRGDRIATSGRDRTVKLWSAKSGALVASFPCERIVVDLIWIDDGRVLVALDKDCGLTILDASRSLAR